MARVTVEDCVEKSPQPLRSGAAAAHRARAISAGAPSWSTATTTRTRSWPCARSPTTWSTPRSCRRALIGIAAARRRALGSRGRGRDPGPAGRSDPHADERAGTGPRAAERPRWRSGGAVLSPDGAEPTRPRGGGQPTHRHAPRHRRNAGPFGCPSRAPRPQMLRQYELIEKVRSYDPTADEGLLNRAYVYAVRMHGSQTRASGDPYFAHPIEVAGILTEYRLDTGLDRHGPAARRDRGHRRHQRDIERAVRPRRSPSWSRASPSSPSWNWPPEHARQAENLRKFILAISKDVRVLMVKLADRLHNMRTLGFIKSPAKRERIARETLDIYAPLARNIGCHRICDRVGGAGVRAPQSGGPQRHSAPTGGLRVDQGEACPAGQPAKCRPSLEAASIPARVYRPREAPVLDLAEAAAQIDRLLADERHLRLPRDRRFRGATATGRSA